MAQRPRTAGRQHSWLHLAERFGLLALFVVVVVYFCLTKPDTFATAANMRAVLTSQAVIAVAALALMIPLVAGNFDLSVGALAVASSILSAGLMSRTGLPLGLAIVLTLCFSTACGALNGALVAYARLDSLIATLGTSTVLTGLISYYSHDLSITSNISSGIVNLGTHNTLGIPRLVLVAAVVVIVVAYLMTQTPLGRKLRAIGSNNAAAQLVGIRVSRLTLTSFVLSGALAGIAGLLMLAQQGAGNPAVGAIQFLIPVLAAVFLGASAFYPGEYNVPGTILGMLFIAVLVSGLTLSGAPPWVESVVTGAALVIAVGISAAFRRQRMGSA
jgi:ribose transport system permease protein